MIYLELNEIRIQKEAEEVLLNIKRKSIELNPYNLQNVWHKNIHYYKDLADQKAVIDNFLEKIKTENSKKKDQNNFKIMTIVEKIQNQFGYISIED